MERTAAWLLPDYSLKCEINTCCTDLFKTSQSHQWHLHPVWKGGAHCRRSRYLTWRRSHRWTNQRRHPETECLLPLFVLRTKLFCTYAQTPIESSCQYCFPMILSKGNCHPSWSLSAKGCTWQQAVPWNKSSWCLHANESCEEKVDHPILPRLANFVQKWVANESTGKWVLMFNVYYCDPCKCCISEGSTADWCTPDIWGLYFVLIPSCVNILTNFMKMADCNCWQVGWWHDVDFSTQSWS